MHLSFSLESEQEPKKIISCSRNLNVLQEKHQISLSIVMAPLVRTVHTHLQNDSHSDDHIQYIVFVAEVTFGSGLETNAHRLEVRQKQIMFGKNTIGYDNYLAAVPK